MSIKLTIDENRQTMLDRNLKGDQVTLMAGKSENTQSLGQKTEGHIYNYSQLTMSSGSCNQKASTISAPYSYARSLLGTGPLSGKMRSG